MNEPVDVATAETVAFLTANLPPAARLIEVGCGEGGVAHALQERGCEVVGIDADADTVARAVARGAPVVHAAWPDFDGEPVDAVVFTRSLHHIGALQPAISKARDILKPGGKLLIEDFAFDAVDAATIEWFVEIVRSQSLADLGASQLLSQLDQSNDPAAVWMQHHQAHEVCSWEAMARCVADCFNIEQAQSVPYLYRYLIPVLPNSPDAAIAAANMLEDEARRAGSAQIVPIGRRMVGTLRVR
jgi:SAM-dependent methyltransferase